MRRLILICCALPLYISVLAQENFLPGYVITNFQDTVQGYIDYKDWKVNPTSISFKKENEGHVMIYTPLLISGFSVSNEFYKSAQVEIETSPDRLEILSYQPEFKIENEVAFVQCLVKGNKSLYYLMNRIGKENFYITQGDSLELLLYKKYARSENYTRQMFENKKYLGQLALYLNDCPSIQSKISTKRYLKNDLEKLFTQYYQCKGEPIEYGRKKKKAKMEFGVVAGLTISSLSVQSKSITYLKAGEYEKSTDPMGGLYFTLSQGRNNGRFSLHNELLLTSYEITGYYLDYEHEDFYTETDMTFKATQLKLNTLFRLKIPVHKFDLRFELGISNAHALSISTEKVETKVFYSPPEVEKSPILKDVRKYEQGIVGGIGLSYSRFSFTTRYELSNGMSRVVDIKTTFNRFHFMAGYRLTK